MPQDRVTKKATSKKPKLRLNKDSLQPVSEAALRDIEGADHNTCSPCVWPSTSWPGCPPPPACTSQGCY
jgi:hypothetical protein